MLPTHAAMIYCREGTIFQDCLDLPTQFKMMKKSLNIHCYSSDEQSIEPWFPQKKDSDLGSRFAVNHAIFKGIAAEFCPTLKRLNHNLRVMTRFVEIKLNEYQMI